MSKKLFFKNLCFAIMLCTSVLHAESNNSNNYLLPNAQFVLTTPVADDLAAASFLAEIGAKNLRGDVTLGVQFAPCQRIKFTGEYLTQELNYRFNNSYRRQKWTSQYAVGGEYQYLLCASRFSSIDVGAALSHAPHTTFDDTRRATGSNGKFGYIGTTINLTECAQLQALANYDKIQYNRHFASRRDVQGWGATVNLTQQFCNSVLLNLTAELRNPFNFYGATINWFPGFGNGALNLGLYGNYTDGKKGLPNATVAGIQIGYTFGGGCCGIINEQCCTMPTYDLATWVATPAVYLPVVLAISDERTTIPDPCPSITTTPIPTQTIQSNSQVAFSIAGFFQSAQTITFSATGLPSGLSINQLTGEITGGTGQQGSFPVTVTATTTCSVSQTFTLQVQ